MFSGCTVLSDSKESELENSNQEASPSAVKNTGIVLAICRTWKCVLQPFLVVWIFLRSLGVICYDRSVLSEGHKTTSRIGIS